MNGLRRNTEILKELGEKDDEIEELISQFDEICRILEGGNEEIVVYSFAVRQNENA